MKEHDCSAKSSMREQMNQHLPNTVSFALSGTVLRHEDKEQEPKGYTLRQSDVDSNQRYRESVWNEARSCFINRTRNIYLCKLQ